MFAFEKLPGLPRDRIVEAIAPVLRAHGLAGVELIWRTDGQGRVLQVTLEKAAAESSGAAPGAAGSSAVDPGAVESEPAAGAGESEPAASAGESAPDPSLPAGAVDAGV